MADHRETISPEDIPGFLRILEEGDTAAQCDVLTRLCPCRSRCADRDVWLSILHAHECSFDPEVRDRAKHALETLRDHARTNPQLRELAQWLSEREDASLLRQPVKVQGRVTSRDVPDLLAVLGGDDAEAQCDALHHLCPCRSRRYDQEVWLAIFRAYEDSEDMRVRDQALHAIETLRGRVRTDPRTQNLVRSLADQSATAAGLEAAIPFWNPRSPRAAKGELPIPRWERSHRSKKNKQK